MAIGINLQKLLNAWNIRGMMMVSLGVQIVLACAVPYRRNTSRSLTAVIVWSTYLLADLAAMYAFGLIANSIRSSHLTPLEVNQDVLALWASFLLIHMGGPDTITAYSLEDNSLWLRHLMRLLGQLGVFSYIFLKTFPGNNLVAPTMLVLATGVMKYAERTMALYLASLDNLKSSITKRSIRDLPTDERFVKCYFSERFRGMIVDVMPSPGELEESREFFKTRDAKIALEVVSVELKLIYEVLYTKIMAVYSGWGIFRRCLVYVNMVAVLVLFCLSRKDQFDGIDVRITYCLLVGVFVVDMSRGMLSLKSEWALLKTDMRECFHFLDIFFIFLTVIPNLMIHGLIKYFSGFGDKSWSEDMGAFNLLDCSIRKYCRSGKKRKDSVTRFCRDILDKAIDWCGLTDTLDKMMRTSRNAFKEELWVFIFDELKRKASNLNEEKARETYEYKGESVLQEMNLGELKKNYMEDFDYDMSLLCWHIATEICYNVDKDKEDRNRDWSKILSDYQMYLLIHRPKLTAAIVGVGHERYVGTCLEVKELVNKLGAENLKDFCKKVLEGRARDDGAHDHEKSVLPEGCDLARILINCDDKWKIIARVWTEMLSYAAGHCRGEAHARAVSEGGELLTHVWLLMAHLGITARWPKTEMCKPKRPGIP